MTKKEKELVFLIPLGNGSRCDNDELRILLRSIEKNARERARIVVMTKHAPEWLKGVEVLDYPDPWSRCKDKNLIFKTLNAIEDLGLEDFCWCADDNAILREMWVRKYPPLYVPPERDFEGAGDRWVDRLERTKKFFKIGYDWESHAPQYFSNAQKILSGMADIPWRDLENGLTIMTALRESCALEENAVPHTQLHEAVESADDARFCAFYGYTMSYTDEAFLDGRLRESLFKIFSTPSKWEK